MNFRKSANLVFGIASLTLGICVTGASRAQAGTLTFPSAGNGIPISQSYGDETNLDVSYQSLISTGNSIQGTSDLYSWGPSYSDLLDVAYSGSSVGEVFLKPLNGAKVTLFGFDLGSWPNVDRTSQYYVYNADYSTLLASAAPVLVSGTTHFHVPLNLTSSDGIRIQFGPDSYNVGIDNINFSVSSPTAVPTPALLPGLIGLGVATLRKRKSEKVEAKV